MKILFAAGDVGGARAILPVARMAERRGHKVLAHAHGTLRDEGSSGWHWLDTHDIHQNSIDADIVLYATSVADNHAIQIASKAQQAGKPCIHVLDNWSSYSERIERLIPDAYTVMDQLALDEALAAGVPAEILHITGHPDLAKLSDEKNRFSGPTTAKTILFVSEPAAQDGGVVKRGYDEAVVMKAFFSALCSIEDRAIDVRIAPHPREDRQAVQSRANTVCAQLEPPLTFSMVSSSDVRTALHSSSHVIGMSSILLYEAWLLGRSVLSLQPGLKPTFTKSLSQRNGLLFHDDDKGISEAVDTWLSRNPGPATEELVSHQNAAQSVMTLIDKTVQRHAVSNVLIPTNEPNHLNSSRSSLR
ncbi:MAG: hypothetical protein AB8B97_21340 [Granulosicoccus sp.]